MSWSTTRARHATLYAATLPTATVHNRVRTDIDREDAENALKGTDGKIRCVEFTCAPGVRLPGASGYLNTTMRVQTVMTYWHGDSGDSYGALIDDARKLQEAIADPVGGFPQLTETGILTTDAGTVPLKLRTGHSALRLVFVHELYDVEAT